MKLTEFIQDAIKNKGYPKDYFITEIIPEVQGEHKTHDRALVMKVDRIEFPVDKKKLADIFDTTSIEFIIVSDDENVIIYDKDADGPDGVYDFSELPTIYNTDEESEDNLNAELFRDQLNYLSKNYRGSGSGALIHNAVMIATRLYREGELSKLSHYNNPFGIIDKAVEDLTREYPGVFMEEGDYSNSELLEVLSSFSDYKFEPSFKMARELYNFEHRRHSSGIDSDAFDYARKFLKPGTTSCFAGIADFPAMVNDLEMDITTPRIFNAASYRYLSGSKNNLEEYSTVCPGDHVNQLIFPAFGAISDECCISDSRFPVRRSEEVAFEHALDNLREGGRVVALMPNSFLTESRYEPLRRRVVKEFGLRAILKVKNPYKGANFDGCLIIVDKEKHSDVFVSDGYLDMESADGIADLIEGKGDCPGDSLGYRTVPSESYDTEGFQFNLFPSLEDLKGIPLKDCADIITGVNVPSSECYPEGVNTGLAYLRISNIKGGAIDLNGSKRLSPDYMQDVPMPGDIVLSIHGVVGKTAPVENHVFVPSKQIVLIRPKDFVSTETLLNALRSKQAQDQMNLLSSGNVLKSISVSKLKEIKLIL